MSDTFEVQQWWVTRFALTYPAAYDPYSGLTITSTTMPIMSSVGTSFMMR
jgi:hypothetical protein